MTKEIIESMRQFAESYAIKTNTFFCSDKAVTAFVLEGLAQNKKEFSAPLCPCRYYNNKEEEAVASFWNRPCLPMRERKECHCMLFLTSNNEYASTSQKLSKKELETLIEKAESMGYHRATPEWYYEHSQIRPLWDDDGGMSYIVEIPMGKEEVT